MFYSVFDINDYYECCFYNKVPAGTVFHQNQPGLSEILNNKIITYAEVDRDNFKIQNGNYILKNDLDYIPKIKSGQILSPLELLKKHQDKIIEFNSNIKKFAETIKEQKFIVLSSKTLENGLLELFQFDKEHLHFNHFGSLDDVKKIFESSLADLKKESSHKQRISFDLSDYKVFDNFYKMIGSKNIDYVKMSYLIRQAKIKPKNQIKLSYIDCFLRTSQDADNNYKSIAKFKEYNWVKYLLSSSL